MANPSVVTAGLVCLDVVCRGKEPARFFAGGTASNVAANLSWMGWQAQPVARLGKDADASYIRQDLAAFGVLTKLIRSEEGVHTPRILETLPPAPLPGRPTHAFHQRCRSCGEWFPQFRPFVQDWVNDVLQETGTPSVFFVDRAFPASADLSEAYSSAGALVVFEPNGAKVDRSAQRILDVANVVKVSSDRVSARAFDSEAQLLIETMGAEGLWFTWKGKERRLEPPMTLTMTDTAGAGDILTAAFLAAWKRSRVSFHHATLSQVEKWLAEAQTFASAKCAFLGARGHMYALEAREFKRLAKGTAPQGASPEGLTERSDPACLACGSITARRPENPTSARA